MNYGYGMGDALATGVGILLVFFVVIYLIALVLGIFTIVCNWKIYKKAGKKGWAVLIPIYNVIVLLEIVNLPIWYILLFAIPLVNIYVTFKINIELAKKFGQSAIFGIGLIFLQPIFLAIIAFNKNIVYEGNIMKNLQSTFNSTCKRCGAPINIDDKFCMNCGNQL